MSLYRQALGPVGVERNIRVFSVFEATGRTRPGWNWAAAFFTLHWMVFYRLWRPAAFYTVLATLLIGLFLAADAAAMPTLVSLLGWLLVIFGVVGTVVPGLYGDALLYAQTELRVHNAIADSKTLVQANTLLARRAGNTRKIGWQALAHLVLLAVGSVAMIVDGMPDAPPLVSSKEPEATMATPIAAQPLPVAPILPLNHTAPAPVAPVPSPVRPPAPGLSIPIGDSIIAATPTAIAPTVAPKPITEAPETTAVVEPQQKIISQPPAPPKRPETQEEPEEPEEPEELKEPLPRRRSKIAVNPPTMHLEPPQHQAKVYSSRDASQPVVQLPIIRPAAVRVPHYDAPPASAPAPGKTPSKVAVQAPTQPLAEIPPPNRSKYKVERERSDEQSDKSTVRFFIHAGTFSVASNAEKVRARIEQVGFPVILQSLADGNKAYLRVRVGPFGSRAEVDSAAAKLRLMGLDAMIYGR